LSKERREDFLKQVRQLGEEARVALRNIRRDCVDAVREAEKRSGLSKDLSRSQQVGTTIINLGLC
jgi:ribosome recycling factor